VTSDNAPVIRRQDKDDFLLITQHDHALLAGELAEQFGNAYFAAPEPQESAIRGVSLHDCGWPTHDDRPTRNADGLPLDVFETPREIALPVWTTSADRAAAKDPYAGLLVSLHVLSLSVFATTQTSFEHEKFDTDNPPDRFAVAKFQHREIERQEDLRAVLGLRTEKVAHHHGSGGTSMSADARQRKEDQLTYNFRMLQAMDAISLAACCTKPPSRQTQDVFPEPGAAPMRLNLARSGPSGNDVIVDPWPFAIDLVTLMIPVVRIAGTKYESDEALREAVAAGSSEVLTCMVRPAD
jgi:hypothetical protein